MATDTTIHLINDERSLNWQNHLLESIDEQQVFDRVRRFYIDLIDNEINRVDSGHPHRGDLDKNLIFQKNTPELCKAADLAFTYGMSSAIDTLIANRIDKYKLIEQEWFSRIDRDQFRSVVYEVVLRDYVVDNHRIHG